MRSYLPKVAATADNQSRKIACDWECSTAGIPHASSVSFAETKPAKYYRLEKRHRKTGLRTRTRMLRDQAARFQPYELDVNHREWTSSSTSRCRRFKRLKAFIVWFTGPHRARAASKRSRVWSSMLSSFISRSGVCMCTSECITTFQAVSLSGLGPRQRLMSVRGHSLEEPGVTKNDIDVKRVKSVTLDRKLSSTARLPQRSTVVESPAGRMADANGQVVSARNSTMDANPTTPTTIITPDDEAEEGPSTTIDVIRPAFARNNTSVMIISEGSHEPEERQIVDKLTAVTLAQEDDAITLGDIPLLADQTIRAPRRPDGRVAMSSLNMLQSLIVKHFALLLLQKSPIGHVIELDEVLDLLDSRKNQWWNKIFKGNQKKDQKKKGKSQTCDVEQALMLRHLWCAH